MKWIMSLLVLSTLISCGKTEKTKKTTQNFSLSTLQASGISFYSNNPYTGARVTIICSDNQTTISKKINDLTEFKNSIGLNNKNTTGFTIGNQSLSPSETEFLFNSALSSLRLGNPSSTFCPREILATI